MKTIHIFTISLFFLVFAAFHAEGQKLTERKVRKILEQSSLFKGQFTGFVLYDAEKNKTIFELNAEKYFIPASNTKLFTFYTALELLGDSIPGLRYYLSKDSLIFWGTGDPSFLHPSLKTDRVYQLLKNSNQKLYYSAYNYSGDFYGYGWQLDNYNDYYQTEINALPLYGNMVLVSAGPGAKPGIQPAYFKVNMKQVINPEGGDFRVKRQLFRNEFLYPPQPVPAGFKQQIPTKTSIPLTRALLQDTLKKTITITNRKLPGKASALYSIPADSAYKQMLQESDNFVAEQLLLVCSSLLSDTLSATGVIEYSRKNLLTDLPDIPQWVDGSGLSRHNLFTPRSIVRLLIKIKNKVGDEERLHSLLPAGGKTGTLRNVYQADEGIPFVWAKTGSLSNNYNQSGYLHTRKGRRLIFSFMNNNFLRPGSEVRSEIARIITHIYNTY